MLFPEVPEPQKSDALLTGYGAAVGLGLWCYWLLRPLRRWGRLGRAAAQFWAWWVAVASGQLVAAWIGGPYVFAGPLKGGGWMTEPLTPRELIVMASLMAAAYALLGLFAPYSPPPRGGEGGWRSRPKRERRARTRRRRERPR
jgi:hypothetical protein